MRGSYLSAKLSSALIFWMFHLVHHYPISVSGHGRSTLSNIQDVTVILGVNKSIARVSENFICATLDWWPPQKCDYGTCSWGHSSLLNLDLTNPILRTAVAGLSPVLLRLGGTLQDAVIYDIGNIQRACRPFSPGTGLFGFSEGCLNMSRWQDLNKFFQETGSQVAFGLNALYGREKNRSLPWDSSNARSFIQFTAKSGYQIYAWELGNELSSSGIGAKLSVSQYADAAMELRSIVNDVYAQLTIFKPYVVAPDGFFDEIWYRDLLLSTGSQVLNACTYHIYNLGPGVSSHELEPQILNPAFYTRSASTFHNVRQTLETYGPWAQAWVGESGGAYNSGNPRVSHSFLDSFWYVDQLGTAAAYDHQVYCRQTLIGGNYGLLNTTTFHPNPDYYSALLWKKLMGREVLSAILIETSYVRAYAHCSEGDTHSVTIVLINLSNTTQFNVHIPLFNSFPPPGGQQSPGIRLSVFGDFFSHKARRTTIEHQSQRLEYHLTAESGDLLSHKVLLNGNVLEMTLDGSLPALVPMAVDKLQPVVVAPTSIAFVKIPDVSAPACLLAGP